jgi:hypothetical protein
MTTALAAPVLEFDDASHTYRLDGAVIPSVSSILQWRFGRPNVPAHILDVAADRGRKAHLACELWDIGDLDEESIAGTDLAGYLRGWAKWSAPEDEPERWPWELIEHRMWTTCEGVTYSGTVDRFCPTRGICDIKSKSRTGRAPAMRTPEWLRVGLQLAAYESFFATADWGRVDRRSAVYLWPNGHVQQVDYDPWNDEFDEGWRALLRDWRAAKAAEEEPWTSATE